MKAHGSTNSPGSPTTGMLVIRNWRSFISTNGDGISSTNNMGDGLINTKNIDDNFITNNYNMLAFGEGLSRFGNVLKRTKRQMDMGRYDPSAGNGYGSGPVAGGFMNPGYQSGGQVFNPAAFMPNMGGLQPAMYPPQQQYQPQQQYPMQLPPQQQMLPHNQQQQQLQPQQFQDQQQQASNGPQGHWPQLPDPQDLGIEIDDDNSSESDQQVAAEDQDENGENDEGEVVEEEEEREAKSKQGTSKSKQRKIKNPG